MINNALLQQETTSRKEKRGLQELGPIPSMFDGFPKVVVAVVPTTTSSINWEAR